ncbi:MAG: flippase activity-associated protein Agl23 [Planctomycetota bacterium]|jgi:uncharacterized protein (TIGR03663 family)
MAKRFCILILIAMIGAIALRLPRLKQRPMHGDEAVHAVKFGKLLEQGNYSYNRYEYHGPTLNYLTLIPARLSSAKTLAELNEFALRIVPVFFGLLLVLTPLLLTKGLGRYAVISAAIFTAISPAFVFYSRYYIHEMLLVCFTSGVIACGYRYTQNKNIKWALLTGLFIGLMHATKETCIIAFGSMLLALVLTTIIQRKHEGLTTSIKKKIPLQHILTALLTASIVSALFYSSFFANPRGILDSFAAYTAYFQRAGQNQWHIHPWYYYLDILTWMEGFERVTWNEDFIVVAAGFGFIIAMTRKGFPYGDSNLVRFIAFYTLIMTIAYSAIPYKTPWSMLSFLHGMILLTGVGTAVLIKMSLYWWEKLAVGLLLVFFGLLLPLGQAYMGSYKYYADPSNPYVYAHPVPDVLDITERIEEIALAHPDGHNMYIQVICPDDDYWPLPWYLRRFSNVGWWNKIDQGAPAAPVIIASPSVEPALLSKLYELPQPGQKDLYLPLFDSYTELRPEVELRGYVTKNLWDSYQQKSSKTSQKAAKGER